jgi:acetyltransferase-like isoleucine patch superfamily enzyme
MSENLRKRFKNWKPPEFDERGMTKWNWMCQYHENLELEEYTDIGAFTYINASAGVKIGEGVEIGSHCSIYSNNTIDEKKGPVHIKKNAKVGTHSTVMPGVTIGENSLVGAYSFVKEDIPDNVVAYGVPAKVVRKIDKTR